MNGQESGVNRRIPKNSPPPPHPTYPTGKPVQRLNRITVHAFLSASLQDNLWTVNRKQSRHLNLYQYSLQAISLTIIQDLNSEWFSTDQKYIDFKWYKNAYLSISCKYVEIKICFQKIDKMEGAAFIENSNLRKFFL